MGFWGRLLKRKSAANSAGQDSSATTPGPASPTVPAPAPEVQPPPSAAATAETVAGANIIHVLDQFGRQLEVPRDEWRDHVLLPNIRTAWDKPDELYHILVSAINDGFEKEILSAAEQLYRIDPDRHRATTIWGHVLITQMRLDEAVCVFRDYIDAHEESSFIWTQYAKVFWKRGELDSAKTMTWRALEVDPNNEHALQCYLHYVRLKDGEAAVLRETQRVARLPGSWRAPLFIARAALEANELREALASYERAISIAPRPVPADVLTQITCDLGTRGHMRESLKLVTPHFNLDVHGLPVGNNLIRAYFDLQRYEEARELLERMYRVGRNDWKPTLDYWDSELTKVVQPSSTTLEAPPELEALIIEGPVWATFDSGHDEFVADKSERTPFASFFASSLHVPADDPAIDAIVESAGRFGRALPLFLAEQVFFNTELRSCTIIAQATGHKHGFIVFGGPAPDRNAIQSAISARRETRFVIASHLQASSASWKLDVRIIRTADASLIKTLITEFDPIELHNAIPKLSREILAALIELGGVRTETAPEFYSPPDGAAFGNYLLRLGQLLSTRTTKGVIDAEQFLLLPREIVDGNLQLCVSHPSNATVRIVLARTIQGMKAVFPELIAEFHDKLVLLQEKYPIEGSLGHRIQEIFDDVLTKQA